jgi:hypothetical protein
MAEIKLNNPLKSNLNVKFSVSIYKYVKFTPNKAQMSWLT